MRSAHLFLFMLIGMFITLSSAQVLAQKAFDHCKNAEHTADILTCLNKRSDASAAKLNKVYERVEAAQSADMIALLKLAQAEWIKYRDGQCGWAKVQAENESLYRIEELSCLITLAEQRREVLEQFSASAGEEGKIDEEQMTFPRWMNVVAHQNPAVYWRYGDHVSADLNCDGQDEEILLGQTMKAVANNEGETAHYTPHSVLAVVSNPAMGKPEAAIVPLEMVASEGKVCAPKISFIASEKADPARGEEDAGAVVPRCTATLEIAAKGCASQTLRWMGGKYVFDVSPKPNEQ